MKVTKSFIIHQCYSVARDDFNYVTAITNLLSSVSSLFTSKLTQVD